MKKNFTLILLMLCFSWTQAQVITIAEARMMNEDDTVTVSGTTTNGSEMGIIRYFEDGTAGIPAYGPSVSDVDRHDSITVTGILKYYNGLLELDPIITLEDHGPADVEIEPVVYTADEIGEETEGSLVQINNVIFNDGGGTFDGGNTYNFTADGESGVIYLRNGHDLSGEIIPVSAVTMIGISSQFSFTGVGGHQILPRDQDDIINESALNIVSSIDQSEITASSFTLSWVTDNASSTGVYYSTDQFASIDDMELSYVEESVTEHSISLSGLEAGNVYFARAFSTAGTDTSMSNLNAYATVSNSSGEIVVLFNYPVNTDVANSEENHAIYTDAIDDSVASWIDKSMISLDIAMYNLNRDVIQDAINDAYDRGVQVRYIAEGGNANIGLDYLNTNIPVLERQFATSSGMHNKFMIIDADSTENAWIMGGSTNFTINMINDPNDMVFIQDQSLARGYEVEFEEMWGSSGANPDNLNSRFGEDKLNNTPHNFIIDGKEVELYFSPSDGVTGEIIKTVQSTQANMYFSTLVFTRDDISEAVIAVNDDFITNAQGMIEQVNVTGSEYETMVDAGVTVYDYSGLPGSLHHKMAIVDPNQTGAEADPKVLTGSHNWSSSAENSNDENILIIHDADIANQYYQEYIARKHELTVGIDELGKALKMQLYPNPAYDLINLLPSNFEGQTRIDLRDMSGKTVMSDTFNANAGSLHSLNISQLKSGIYIINIFTDNGNTTLKFIKH